MWEGESPARFGDAAEAYDRAAESAAEATAAFSAELSQLRQSMTFTSQEVGRMSSSFGSTVRNAFDGVVFDGMKLSDALRGVAKSMADTIYSITMRPIQSAIGGALAQGVNGFVSKGFAFADGGAFSQGRVMAFAKGGVVSGPTTFPMRNATGLMGEAGPEAIMPLTRGPDGRLGVQSAGGGRPVHVTMNISTPDVAGFSRSQSQIAAQMARALARGERNR